MSRIKLGLAEEPQKSDVPISFINKVIDLIGNAASYYAIDVAETQSGEWIVIEINDGQMSGLSQNDPDELYTNLKNVHMLNCFVKNVE